MRTNIFSKIGCIFPVFKVFRFIKLSSVLCCQYHYPLLMGFIPSHFWITEITNSRVLHDRISFLKFLPCKTIVIRIRHILLLDIDFIFFFLCHIMQSINRHNWSYFTSTQTRSVIDINYRTSRKNIFVFIRINCYWLLIPLN
ncbi:hypothetical protein D3C84_256460 [compost metagenome]